jgi:tRNA nucleotidyltransferase/poly(A) polymerase
MKPDAAIDIVRRLREQNFVAYLVGGCVRDMVMKIEPSDYDIATSARPDEVMRIFPRTQAVGAKFGVVLVIYRGHPFEVATFRSDRAYIDGRRPSSVVFTDAKEDVQRRDFTINGLLYDPIQEKVIDYVGGQKDIEAKLVRAIRDPRERFSEDKLRILRAVRFSARFRFTIEPATWQAMREMAPQIHQVSSERIRYELVRILTEGQAAYGIRLLHESGLRQEILPELEWNEHIDRSLQLLRPGGADDFATAVLLHDLPPEQTGAITERLKFSRAEMHHIVALVENLPKFSEVPQMSISSLKRLFRLARFEDHLELARIHAIAGETDLFACDLASRRYAEWSLEEIAPKPLISGEDLIKLGFSPGPRFREILTRVEDEQLEGRLSTAQEAIDFVSANYGEGKS